MDTRKVTFIATIAAIILVAVGIGYAYTAATVNSGNNASSEYITLIQDNYGEETTGAYQFANGVTIKWDSLDYREGVQPKTDFTLASETVTIGTFNTQPLKAIQLGKPFVVEGKTNKATPADSIDVIVKATNIVDPYQVAAADKAFVVFKVDNGTAAELKYYVAAAKSSGVNSLQAYDNTWARASSFDNKFTMNHSAGGVYTSATITAYYATVGDLAVTVNHAAGTPAEPPISTILDNARLTFTVTVASWNGSGAGVTGITVSPTTVTTTVGADPTAVTVTVTAGDHATNKNFIAYSSNTTVATVAISDATTITITGVAAGTATITLITEEGGYSVDIPVTVNAAAP